MMSTTDTPKTTLEIKLNARIQAFSKFALLIRRANEILNDDLKIIESGGEISTKPAIKLNVPDNILREISSEVLKDPKRIVNPRSGD